MHLIEATVPEAYPRIVELLKENGKQGSRVGDTREELSVIVRSDDPRERFLYRPGINVAFMLQEAFAWWNGLNPGDVQRYNSNMERYIQDDGEMLGSAYGRYLRHLPHDQIVRVIDQLKENPDTRRAVINIHNAAYEDYDSNDVACTVYLQFLVRDGQLNCVACLRSQDILWGLPYDSQNFCWIQEAIAGILDLPLGWYEHRMNSAHYYTDFEDQVRESVQNMEIGRGIDCRLDHGDLALTMQALDVVIARAQKGEVPDDEIESLEETHGYYADWARLMVAYEHYRFHDNPEIADRVSNSIGIDHLRKWMRDKL